jgi:hypothetical protein
VLVLTACSFVLAIFLLGVFAILSSVIPSPGAFCGPAVVDFPCVPSVFDYVFLIPGIVSLALGAVGLLYLLKQGLR